MYFFLWQLPKPDDLAVVCYTSGTTGTCHCITDFGVDPNGHLQRHAQPLEILSVENVSFAALLQPCCPAITAHPTPTTHKSTYPQIMMCVLFRILSLGLCEAQTISNGFTWMLHTLSLHSFSVMKLCHQKLWAILWSLEEKIIVGVWRKFWAKFQTEAEKSWKVNFILDKQENWEIGTVSMGYLILISRRGWLRGWL